MKPPRTLGLARSEPSWVALQRHIEQVSKVLSNISFGTTTSNTDPDMNMDVWKTTGVAPVAPNTDFTVTHNLGHVPFGFIITKTDRAGHIYQSATAATAATNSALGTLVLRCDTASVAFGIIIL